MSADYNELTVEMARARYHSPTPMPEWQTHECWLALRREMLRSKWAEAHNLHPEEVGIAVNPESGKAYFQWNGVLKFIKAEVTA